MVSTSMVYGCTIDVFNTEDISVECVRTYAGKQQITLYQGVLSLVSMVYTA